MTFLRVRIKEATACDEGKKQSEKNTKKTKRRSRRGYARYGRITNEDQK